MRRQTWIAALALLLAAICAKQQATAQQDRWLHLGQANLIGAGTEALIPAGSTRQTVCAIRMQSSEPVEVEAVTVHFSNHQSQRIQLHTRLSSEGYSQTLALPGIRRSVAGVTVLYALRPEHEAVPAIWLWGNQLPGAKYCPK